MTSMSALSSLLQNHLSLQMVEIPLRELIALNYAPCDIYHFSDGLFKVLWKKETQFKREVFKDAFTKNIENFFVVGEDHSAVQAAVQDKLLKITRSLSVGDPINNGKKSLYSLSLSMMSLYKDPHNDEVLGQQFQGTQNLAQFLTSNKKIQKEMFHIMNEMKFHYTIAQPMLSSLMLLSFLQQTHMFSEKDIQNLFVASHFKDIGMSHIPEESFEKGNLSDEDKELFSRHSHNSYKILKGRTPLSPTTLEIINNHHHVGSQLTSDQDNQSANIIKGAETTMMGVMDMLVAMTSDRPYRDGVELFHALESVKLAMGKEYAKEFKYFVQFLQRYLSR